MLVRSNFTYAILKSRSWRADLGPSRVRFFRNVNMQLNTMESNGQLYKDWSHESLIERVALLEKQLKDQTEKYNGPAAIPVDN